MVKYLRVNARNMISQSCPGDFQHIQSVKDDWNRFRERINEIYSFYSSIAFVVFPCCCCCHSCCIDPFASGGLIIECRKFNDLHFKSKSVVRLENGSTIFIDLDLFRQVMAPILCDTPAFLTANPDFAAQYSNPQAQVYNQQVQAYNQQIQPQAQAYNPAYSAQSQPYNPQVQAYPPVYNPNAQAYPPQQDPNSKSYNPQHQIYSPHTDTYSSANNKVHPQEEYPIAYVVEVTPTVHDTPSFQSGPSVAVPPVTYESDLKGGDNPKKDYYY